ncbi:MAG: DUF3426 domain-containing protein [Rhodanobacter sp.]|nr:MAG: DUF3426 domain-containing protein [Rhodanobacter sp.]
MYTQCPECLTVFSLDAATLAQARGYVACSNCAAEFDALPGLTDQLPPEPFRQLPIQAQAERPPALDLAVYRPKPEPPAVRAEEAEAQAPAAPDDFSQLQFAPRFARDKGARKTRRSRHRHHLRHRQVNGSRTAPWVITCALLTVSLGLQLAWINRDMLIRNPIVGGWLRQGCTLLDCRLPLVAAPDQLRLLASNVQAHPSVPDALMISASVRNEAPFAQPYPVVTITLSNASGKRVAMRRLLPHEYLDDDAIRRRGMAPGASTVLLFEVQDPGDNAVAFEFGFE